jgi:tetratricopeptide (TPR) repeat protein
MMKISRYGIFILLLMTVVLGANCSYYNRLMARKSLVDGATSYNDRNFKEAEERFRRAVAYDPDLSTEEGRMAQLFLARTIHSEFASNRNQKNKAESAIKEYQVALKGFLSSMQEVRERANANPQDEKAQKELKQTQDSVGSIVRAVASLYENLKQEDKWQEWQTTQAANEQLPNDVRAGAYVSLAAREYSCANDITDTEEIKKTVKEGDKEVFQFVKPEAEESFQKLKNCVDKGMEHIDKAVQLNPDSDSAWSYKASLTEQKRRIAEMNGEEEQVKALKDEFTKAKKRFEELLEKRQKAEVEEARQKAEAAAKKSGRKVQSGEDNKEKPAEAPAQK